MNVRSMAHPARCKPIDVIKAGCAALLMTMTPITRATTPTSTAATTAAREVRCRQAQQIKADAYAALRCEVKEAYKRKG